MIDEDLWKRRWRYPNTFSLYAHLHVIPYGTDIKSSPVEIAVDHDISMNSVIIKPCTNHQTKTEKSNRKTIMDSK